MSNPKSLGGYRIEFLVQKWIDEAHPQSILEYASNKLKEYYHTLSEDKITELYEESLEDTDATNGETK